jgi:hypothetical protein
LFAYFMTYHAVVIIDRDTHESPQAFTWSGRIAHLRQHTTRFFERGGGGSSEVGGGGWDFHRLIMACDRSTGALTLSAEPIEFEVTQAPSEIVSPPWVTEELKLMGWKPLKSIDFFGEKLLPPEYSQAIDRFNQGDATAAREILYRRWAIEKSLPQPFLVLGLLYDQAGQREEAYKWIKQAAGYGAKEPGTLADIARWELSVGKHSRARTHAKAALASWPNHPVAANVLNTLDQRKAQSN